VCTIEQALTMSKAEIHIFAGRTSVNVRQCTGVRGGITYPGAIPCFKARQYFLRA